MTAVGIDVGGTKCLAVRLDGEGQVVAEHRVPTPRGDGALVDALVSMVEQSGDGDVDVVGVGVPGVVDRHGVVRDAPNLGASAELPLRERLGARLAGTEIHVANDGTCAAWAEHQRGAARGVDDLVLVTVGTGIGGGIIVDGRPLRGARGFAGEIGSMVVDPYGPDCSCGRRGCWEALASGTALGRMGREAGLGDGEQVARACREGDESARAIMTVLGSWLAVGIVNVVELFDPELVILGGGVSAAADVVLGPVRSAFHDLASGRHPGLGIVPAQLGVRAGAIGAALLAVDSVSACPIR
ncbi:MAG TPA: ROK family protein [Acidimicrobiales bacterium]|nr:ROK family protein [Acidimicrobiales bacterium]